MGIKTVIDNDDSPSSGDVFLVETKSPRIKPSTNPMVASSPIPLRKKRSVPAKKWYEEARKWDNINSRKKVGQRNQRREQNLNFLMDLGGEADLSDYVELTEHCGSSFSELFLEQEKMRLWNDFIQLSEDEQDAVLRTRRASWPGEVGEHAKEEGEHGFEYVREGSGDSWQLVDDNRTVHPAFSAEQCFQRIDHNLKSLLKRRHLPLGKLMCIEKDVTEFFHEWPTCVYVPALTSSYERMLLHCLCQYLDLKSRSFNSADGVRQTEVENRHGSFSPPHESLTQYLEARHREAEASLHGDAHS